MKKVMSLALVLIMVLAVFTACDSAPEIDEAEELLEDYAAVLDEVAEEIESIEEELVQDETETAEEMTEEATEAPTEAPTEDQDLVDGMRPEFKEAMDSYENFMDEYVEFMKKYNENPNDLSLLLDYANIMSKYAEFAEDFEKWEEEDMNAAETAYYIDVQMRVSKKLMEVAA